MLPLEFRLCLFAVWATPIFSLPLGLKTVDGSAELKLSNATKAEIFCSDRSILDWDQFLIAADESVNFALPSENGVVLNRVIGGAGSEIFGSLISNGKVILVDPKGVLIGREAKIDVGSLIASTFSIHEDLFCSRGNLFFCGTSEAEIQSFGEILARDCFALVGANVQAEGSIRSEQGGIYLISFEGGQLFDTGDLQFEKNAARANSIRFNGSIVNPQGNITVLGSQIAFGEQALIDVSSPLGGGTVLIGGDFHGIHPGWNRASTVAIPKGARLLANGLEGGSGGKIAIWSDSATTVASHFEAKGGSFKGDGGFIEVSGAKRLQFDGTADTRAPFGRTGDFLLDPTNIRIIPPGVNANVSVISPVEPIGPGVPAEIIQTTLDSLLMGTNVTVRSSSTSFGPSEPGHVILHDDFTYSQPNTLTLQAIDGDVIINALLENTGTGGFILTSNNGSVQIGGNLLFPQTTPAEVVASSGSISITAQNNVRLVGNGGFYSNVRTQTGSIAVAATTGFIELLADTTDDNFAQIGSPNVGVAGQTVNCPISIASGGALILTSPSGANRNYAQIGHGTASTLFPVLDGAFIGNINLSIGGQATLTANASNTGYAQIGHRTGDAAAILPTNCTGDITGTIQGPLTLAAGAANFAYTHIGHFNSTDNLGQFRGSIDLNLGGPFSLTAGTASNTPSQIGYRLRGSMPLDLLSDLVRVVSTSPLTSSMTGGLVNGSSAVFGGYITNVVPNAGNLITDTVIQTAGNLTLTGGSAGSVAAAAIGMFFSGGAAVDANTNITIDCAGDLTLQSAATGAGNAAIATRGFIFVSSPFTTFIHARNLNMINSSSGAFASVAIIPHGPLTVLVDQNINLSRTNANGTGSGIVGGGNMDITAGNDINLYSTGDFAFFGGARISCYNGSLVVRAGNNIVLDGIGGATIPNFNSQISSSDPVQIVEVIAGRDIIVHDGCGIVGIFQTNIVVDNDFASSPLIGPGSLQLLSGGRIQNTNPGTVDKTNQGLRIFTARQSQNLIQGILSSNGIDVVGFAGGTPYADIPPELWGVYYFSPFFYPGEVFTIFYKDTLQAITTQASAVVEEFLYHLNPIQDFPGWEVMFSLSLTDPYDTSSSSQPSIISKEDYYLLRSSYHLLNHPKSWTRIIR